MKSQANEMPSHGKGNKRKEEQHQFNVRTRQKKQKAKKKQPHTQTARSICKELIDHECSGNSSYSLMKTLKIECITEISNGIQPMIGILNSILNTLVRSCIHTKLNPPIVFRF